MKKNKLRNYRLSKLRKGKAKGVGFFEGLGLKIAGSIDGSRSLPRDNGCDHWVSPHLDREIRSYEEFSSRMWGNLQFENEHAYARLGELMDSLVHIKAQLEDANSDLEAMSAHEGSPDAVRKHGEGKLTDAQVISRRTNEISKRLAPLRSRVSFLQNKLAAETDEVLELRNKIIEDNNSTKMICNRVKDHILQRMDVYWNFALHKHAENSSMPAVPSAEMTLHAEKIYMEPHISLMRKAGSLSQTLSGKTEMEVL